MLIFIFTHVTMTLGQLITFYHQNVMIKFQGEAERADLTSNWRKKLKLND